MDRSSSVSSLIESQPKTFGLISKPVFKPVQPLRDSLINDFKKRIRNGKIAKEHLAKLQKKMESGTFIPYGGQSESLDH